MTSGWREDRTRAAIVVGANVATMGIGYLFQILAARRLASDRFVELSLWLGSLGLLSVLGIFAQVRGTLVRRRIATHSAVRYVQLGLAVLALAAHVRFAGHTPPMVLLLETAAITLASSYWIGVLIGSLRIARVAFSSLASSVVRCLYPYLLGSVGEAVFYEANAVAACVLWLLATWPASSNDDASEKSAAPITDWAPVLILGTVQAALPFAQLFAGEAFSGPDDVNGLARVMVLTRAPVLLGIALLSIAMAQRGRDVAVAQTRPWVERYRFEMLAVGQCVLASAAFAVLGPWVGGVLTHGDFSALRGTFALSGLDHAALVCLLAVVQHHVLRGEAMRGLALALGSSLPILLFVLVRPCAVNVLLAVHTGVCVLALMYGRARPALT